MANILLVDDDDSVRAFVRRALEMDGNGVTEASDGAEAMDALAGGSFDLVLSDIQMPVMDGIALALNVARDHPELPVVLMTGYAHQRERAHGIEEIVRDVIQKPFTLADIRERIAAVLAG
ncbi:MAG: response regulator [Flavobacteriaceae bacterium]